jgi:hypothetical protein
LTPTLPCLFEKVITPSKNVNFHHCQRPLHSAPSEANEAM